MQYTLYQFNNTHTKIKKLLWSKNPKILLDISIYNYYALFSAYYIQSKNYPTHYFGPADNGRDYKIVQNGATKFFMISPGLTGEKGTVSFQPVDAPGHYLRHYGYLLDLEKKDGARNANIFDEDATFRIHENKFFNGFDSYESVNYPNYYIRHQGSRLKINVQDHSELYENDASFKIISTDNKGMFLNLKIRLNIKLVTIIIRAGNGQWGGAVR
jgi:hypothetical protein